MAKLGWYINRLRNMSVPEIGHRFIEHAKKSRARKLVGGWDRFVSDNLSPTPVLPGLAAAVDGASGALRAKAEVAAARFIGGHFSALGVEWPTFTIEEGIDAIWHLDPVSGKHWPSDCYCFDIGYRGSTEMGDVKYVWEFSRLQFLQPVALHARLSADATALAFVERVIASWYASNPPFLGVGWSSGIELSLRSISLLIVTSLVGDRLSVAVQKQVQTMLRAHAFWLARYPSRFSSANNHLVSEDAALYLIGVTCSFVPGATKIAAHAETGLVREAELQILADGVAAEQSPTYGALTSELLLLCAWVAKGLDKPFPDVVESRLGSFAEWIAWLSEDDGTVPAIGDDDEGRVLTLGVEEPSYATSVAAAIAGFIGRSEIAPPHTPTLRNTLAPVAGPGAPLQGTRTFPEGGYTVHRTEAGGQTMTLVIDHAPLGYLAIAAHGHADALSFTLTIAGKPTFVDPGTYLYHSGHQWRDWFRNTRAHNTVAVEGAEQSIISGAFNWSHKARAKLEQVNEGAAPFTLTGSQDGYQGRFGVRHVRQFELADGVLTLHDMLIGGASRQAEIVLQLAADCDVMAEGSSFVVLRGGMPLARVAFPANGNVTQARGEDRVDGGWVSPHFGAKTPATRLSWIGSIGNEGVTTQIELIGDP